MHKRQENLKYETNLSYVKCMNERTCVMIIGWNRIIADEKKERVCGHIVSLFCYSSIKKKSDWALTVDHRYNYIYITKEFISNDGLTS